MNTTPTILITGGAGYIGSHIAWLLAHSSYQVIVIDDLSQPGNVTALQNNKNIQFHQTDFANTQLLDHIFTSHNITAVIHCAAFIEVGNSVKSPLAYYHNNVGKTIIFLEAMRKHKINTFIFSSSCAVYGIPQQVPIAENHPTVPISPYGRTKLMVEQILQDCATAYDLKYVALRYFNAAGATAEHGLGERHEPESHLIPLLLQAALHKKPFTLFGTTHPTPDGTCVRDFVHVQDIAHAHLNALEYLIAGGTSDIFNIGTGKGISVQEIINVVEKITNTQMEVKRAIARVGDPPILVANINKAQQSLAWSTRYSVLEYMVETVYNFERYKQNSIQTVAQAIQKCASLEESKN